MNKKVYIRLDANCGVTTDGSFEGEIVGTIAPNSRFSKLKIGITLSGVNALIKAPDDLNRHETGKRWIPFYYGNDAQRMQALYVGEGYLTRLRCN